MQARVAALYPLELLCLWGTWSESWVRSECQEPCPVLSIWSLWVAEDKGHPCPLGLRSP
jgi:hypothetical protein